MSDAVNAAPAIIGLGAIAVLHSAVTAPLEILNARALAIKLFLRVCYAVMWHPEGIYHGHRQLKGGDSAGTASPLTLRAGLLYRLRFSTVCRTASHCG